MRVDVKNLSFSYYGACVLENIGFSAEGGKVTVLLGNNGAGKSTLLKCIDGILKPDGGLVTVDGEDVTRMSRQKRARIFGYVPQEPAFSDLSVFDSVLIGRSAHIHRKANARDEEVTEEILRMLQLESLAGRSVNSLSGGERQKTAVARALAGEPKILLLDEPTSNLDLKSLEETAQLLRRLAEEKGITVLAAIHDVNLSLRFADFFVMMKGKGVYSTGGRESVTAESIHEVYGVKTEIYNVNGQTVVLPVTNK